MRAQSEGESLPHAVHTGTPVAFYATAGYAVAENVYPEGHRSEHHAHDSPFIGSTLAGCAVAHPENEIVTAGSVGFSPSGRPHSHLVQRGGLRGLTIDILPNYASDFVESGADFTRPCGFSDPAVFQLIRRLQDEIRNPDPLSRFQVDALIIEICVSLARLGRSHESMSVPRWLKRIIAKVEEGYKEEFCLDDLAADARVHPVHVSRVFRRCYGETLGDYIRRLRIKEARRRLEYGSDSIAQIAVDVGYHDESHFSKAFKKVVGTTPGLYRSVVRVSPKIAI